MVLTELLDSPRDVALVMGLDFGTYSSGIACHVVPGGSLAAQVGAGQVVRIMEDWPREPYKYAKTRTALLYKE